MSTSNLLWYHGLKKTNLNKIQKITKNLLKKRKNLLQKGKRVKNLIMKIACTLKKAKNVWMKALRATTQVSNNPLLKKRLLLMNLN